MHPTPLPARSTQHGRKRRLQPFMGVADDELHPAPPPCYQAAQEVHPEGVFLTGPHGKAQHFARLPDPNRDHHGLAHNPMILPHLHVERIEPHLRIAPLQRALAKLLDDVIQLLADARESPFVDAGQPQCFEQVIDPPHTHSLDIRLLNDRQ